MKKLHILNQRRKQVGIIYHLIINFNEISICREAIDGYCPHGLKVVKQYQMNGGLIELEKLWREYFLKTMKPKHLPDLWNINHNADR